MEVLDAVVVADSFPVTTFGNGAQLGPVYRSNGGYFTVTEPVYVRYAYGDQGSVTWTDAVPLPAGPVVLEPGTVGFMLRNYTAGVVAQVSAALSEPGEPRVTVTSSGVATPGSGQGMHLLGQTQKTAVTAVGVGSNVVVASVTLTLADSSPIWVVVGAPYMAVNPVSGAGDTIQAKVFDGATDLGIVAQLKALVGSAAVQATAPCTGSLRIAAPTAGAHTYSFVGNAVGDPGEIGGGAGGAATLTPAWVAVYKEG